MATNKSSGFTMIELVLVISILGILAVAALPTFINVSTQARQASRDGVSGAVRSGIALQRAESLVTGAGDIYPATLDGAADGACGPANLCFTNVLSQGIADGSWTKAGLVYTFNDGTDDFVYTYAPGVAGAPIGSFTCPDAP